jgi:tRNA (cmo5U34)-methyltransferase
MGSPLNRFDKVALFYDSLARLIFKDAIIKSQEYFLPSASTSENALILGGGTGLIALRLLQQHPHLKITYVEASIRMISRAAEHCKPFLDRIRFVHGTQADIPSQKYDVVVTGFFLDMFKQNDVEMLVDKILKKLNHDGLWLVTDFVNTRSILHRVLLSCMYTFFKIACGIEASRLPEWEAALSRRLKFSESAVFNSGFIKSCKYVHR